MTHTYPHRQVTVAAPWGAVLLKGLLIVTVLLSGSGRAGAPEDNQAGLALLSDTSYTAAITAFERALAAAPGNATVLLNLATACHLRAGELADQKHWAAAIAAETRALALQPTEKVFREQLATLHLLWGCELNGKGALEPALRECRAALAANPDDPHLPRQFATASLNYACDLSRQGDNAKALELIRGALKVDAKWAPLHEVLGDLLALTDQGPAAITAWEMATTLGSPSPALAAKIAKARRAVTAEKDFARQERAHFLIKYEGEQREDLAAQLLETLEKAFRDVGRRYESWPERQLTVILYTNQQYLSVTSQQEWNVGLYDGTIRIRLPAGPMPDREALTNTLYHEYTHALLCACYGNSLPRWVQEGLAENSREDMPLSVRTRQVWKELDRRRLVPPWETDAWFDSKEREKSQLAYLEAILFFRYFCGRYNTATIKAFLGQFQARKPLAEITGSLFNLTPAQLYQEWLDAPAP